MLNVKVFSAGVGVAAVTLIVGYSYMRKRAKRPSTLQKAVDEDGINQAFKGMEGERTTVESKSLEVEAREKRIIFLIDPFLLCFHILHERNKWEKERLQLIGEKEGLSQQLLAAERKNQDAILKMEEKMEHVRLRSRCRIEVIVSLQEELSREKRKKQEEILQLIQDKEALANTWDEERLQLIREKEALADKSEQERLQLIQEKEALADTSEQERLHLIQEKEALDNQWEEERLHLIQEKEALADQWEEERLHLIQEKEALADTSEQEKLHLIQEKEALADQWEEERLHLIQEKEALADQSEEEILHLIQEKEALADQSEQERLHLIQEKEALADKWEEERLHLIQEKEALADQSEQERLHLIQVKEALEEEERLQLVKGKEHMAECFLSAEQKIKQEERKLLSSHARKLTLDPATVNAYLALSENDRKVIRVGNKDPCHKDRFVYLPEVRCTEGLTGRCYWEVEWSGVVSISVTKSWYLLCNDGSHGNFYKVNHNGNTTELPVCPSGSNRVGVYLDMPAGTMSFYRVSPATWTHLYNVQSTFSEPFYPGFRCWSSDASVYLCEIEEVG